MASSSSNSADIGIRVFLEDAASAGLFALDSNLGRIGVTAQKASLLFGGLSKQIVAMAAVTGLAASFLGFAGAMVYAVQQGMELNQALLDIQLSTGATAQQMAILQPFLLNLGANSIYSLQQLADGIAVVGQYGFKTTQQIEDMATAGVKLAEVTGSTTTAAFKLLAVTMQAFNIPASQANYVASLLFYSIEHGTPNVANLTSALGQLGGVSTTLHIGLQDLLPALDTVTVGMGTASTAAAGLRYFLVNIVHPTAAASKELDKLGISAFDAQGKFIGLKPLLQEIADRVQGLSDKAKADILGTLFNIRSGTAIKQLLLQIKEYEQGIVNLADKQKVQSALDKAVAAVMGQLGAVAHQVGSNFQDFAALIGQQLIPALSGFLLNVVNPIVVKLRQWASDPASAQIATQFLVIGAAVSGVGMLIVGAFLTPVGAFIAIMLAVMAVVAGAAAGIMALRAHWAQFTAIMTQVWAVTQRVLAVLLVLGATIAGIAVARLTIAFVQFIPTLIQMAVIFWTQTLPAIDAMIGKLTLMAARAIYNAAVNLGTVVPSLMASASAWTANAIAEMAALAPYILIAAVIAGAIVGLVLLIQHLGGLNAILKIGQAVWQAILPALQQAGAAIKGAFLQAVEQLKPVWNQLVQAFNQAKPFLMWLGIALGVLIAVAVAVLIGVLRGLINVFVAVITTVIHVVAGIIQAFAGVIQFFMGFFQVLHGIFTGNFTEIKNGFNQMGKGILNIIQGLWSAVSAVFVGAFSAIKGFVTGFISGIVGFFQNLASTLIHHSIIPDMLNAIISAIAGFVPRAIAGFVRFTAGLISEAQKIPGMVKNALGNLGSLLFSAGQSLIQGFINGLKSMIGNVTGAVGNILSAVRNMFPHSPAKEGPLTDAHLWMPNLVHMLSDTAEKTGPSLKASMGRVAGSARAGLGTPTGGTGGGGAAGETYTLTVDGKAFMSFFHNRLTGELQANGIGRVLR